MTNTEFYNEELQTYKTASSKKAFLTRSKKMAIEFLEDQKKAYSRGGYLHGIKVTALQVRETKNELNTINNLYKAL
tara:strand:+ start:14838 stop:15065 length:228 start_codon:yes stop_codon:yes gene_type:complete